MLLPDPDIKHNLPTELLPKNRHLVEPTPSDCSKPDNAGGLPEPAGHPYPLNATPCFKPFLTILTTVYTSFISGAWHPPPHCENTQVLREAITEDDDDAEMFI